MIINNNNFNVISNRNNTRKIIYVFIIIGVGRNCSSRVNMFVWVLVQCVFNNILTHTYAYMHVIL